VLAAPAPARSAGAGRCPGACPPPALAEPEPALFQALHLTWADPHRDLAEQYEIARRVRGGGPEWILIARPPADRPPHLDDVGARGNGLEPGDYEYRLRALHRAGPDEVWSEWSEPRPATLRAACAESGGELSAALPRIVADDRDGDGRYTGADLERALGECSTFGGCVLEALPVTYDDVAIVISDGDAAACTPGRTACITLTFSRGLVIEGHGSATVLRSPLWAPPQEPHPLLEIWNRPDLRLQLRHLVLDGRKREQRDPQPARADPNTWQHTGFQISNPHHDPVRRSQGGCIHDVVVRDFTNRGIALADVAHWNLERNTIDGIGCDDPLTPCPGIEVPGQPKDPVVVPGTGVLIGGYSDDVLLRENRILRASQVALALKHGSDGAETSIRRPQVLDNQIGETGALGILLAGVADARFEGNRITRTRDVDGRPESAAHDDTAAISCNGSVDRALFLRNRIEDSAGMAIGWHCSGVGNTLAENRIARSCREKGPRVCVPGQPGECYLQPDIFVGPGAAGSLVLVDDEVVESGCSAPFGADLPKPQLELLIRGGRYEAGPLATRPVLFQAVDVIIERAARFEGTPLEFGPATRGVVAPSVSVTGADPAYRADRSAQVLICPAQRRSCTELCEGHDPPRWCDRSDPPPGRR